MKKLSPFLLFFLFSFCAFAQGPNNIKSDPPAGAGAKSDDNSVCDTFNHIFLSAIDTFKSIKGAMDASGSFYVPHSKIPGAKSNGVFSSFYMCCYDYSSDSSKEYETFNNLIKAIKVCLTSGPAVELTNTYVREVEHSRNLMYTYYIKDLKPGYDQKLKNWCVKIEFVPKVTTSGTDYQLFVSVELRE